MNIRKLIDTDIYTYVVGCFVALFEWNSEAVYLKNNHADAETCCQLIYSSFESISTPGHSDSVGSDNCHLTDLFHTAHGRSRVGMVDISPNRKTNGYTSQFDAVVARWGHAAEET